MKIAVNKCYGGFGLSRALIRELDLPVNDWGEVRGDYGSLSNEDFDIESNDRYAYRSHSKLIAAIEKLGGANASGKYAAIEVLEIPDNIEWEIDDYDGYETLHEVHRSW